MEDPLWHGYEYVSHTAEGQMQARKHYAIAVNEKHFRGPEKLSYTKRQLLSIFKIDICRIYINDNYSIMFVLLVCSQ